MEQSRAVFEERKQEAGIEAERATTEYKRLRKSMLESKIERNRELRKDASRQEIARVTSDLGLED